MPSSVKMMSMSGISGDQFLNLSPAMYPSAQAKSFVKAKDAGALGRVRQQ